MKIAFSKMHGLGNDFIVIDDTAQVLDFTSADVRWLCDRNFGIGADGLILVRPSTTDQADFFMHYFNADGSTAEMCGNGIRCFAKYLVDHDLLADDADSVRVETLSGVMSITLTRDDAGYMHAATVDMGEPVLSPSEIPTTIDTDQVFDYPIETPYGTFDITAVSMGNPHAILWVDDLDNAPVDTVGPAIENNPIFPNKTNVEFAQAVGGDLIRLRVWERGVGETLACGTGACATLVAATLGCVAGREAVIALKGGELIIRWHEDGHIYMTGPATEVFEGTIRFPKDDSSATT